MLEHLFGSKTRVRLLQLFLNNPEQPMYLREVARTLKVQLNAVRREVDNLVKLDILMLVDAPAEEEAAEESEDKKKTARKKKSKAQAKYFQTNTDFVLYPELRALLLKAQLMFERNLVSRISKESKVRLLMLTGAFVGNENATSDMLIVGAINRDKLAKMVRATEKQLNRSINYTVFSPQEYKYRLEITDRFLYGILEGAKIVIVDKL